jgi:hypothetical protein
MERTPTRCGYCGRQTVTRGGRCPNCGKEKRAPKVAETSPPLSRRRDLGAPLGAAATTVALIVAAILIGSQILLFLGVLLLCALGILLVVASGTS